MTRSTSASLGIPRLATILAQVRAGTPVAAASPRGASMSSRLAAATRSSASGGVSLASLRGRLLRSPSPSPDLLRRSHAGGLAADAHLAGGLGDAEAGLYAGRQGSLAPSG